ncbi:MAG TPA: hypothetical protein PLT69_11310, partial [Deltaproteobacteria bacterium]|nr:hypothetical protein [Deltaproteobacteria bacterium]
ELGRWSVSEGGMCLRNDSETLYVTDQGRYFIVYEGGMNASFHRLPGVETWFGGSHTREVTIEEAVAWCEETGNDDALKGHLPFLVFLFERAPGSSHPA